MKNYYKELSSALSVVDGAKEAIIIVLTATSMDADGNLIPANIPDSKIAEARDAAKRTLSLFGCKCSATTTVLTFPANETLSENESIQVEVAARLIKVNN